MRLYEITPQPVDGILCEAGPYALMRFDEIQNLEKIDDQYVAELKYDGWLVQIFRDGVIKIYTRNQRDITADFTGLATELAKAIPNNAAVLGEMCFIKQNGKMDINLLPGYLAGKSKADGAPAIFIFDIIGYKNQFTGDMPFIQRKDLLQRVVTPTEHIKVVGYHSISELGQLGKDALKMNAEGVVFKRKDSTFKIGSDREPHTYDWYKYKKFAGKSVEDDFVIYGVEKTKDNKPKLLYGQYSGGKFYPLGAISSLSVAEIKQLQTLPTPIVATLGFQERTDTGKLRHQKFLRFRPDKPAKSCLLDPKYLPGAPAEEKPEVHESIDEAEDDAKWSKILIDSEYDTLTKEDIHSYYMDPRTRDKLFGWLHDRKAIVFQTFSKSNTVLRRNIPGTNDPVTIKTNDPKKYDDPTDLTYWISNRSTEFHVIVGPETDIIWIDIDPHESFDDFNYIKKVAKDAYNIMSKVPEITKVMVKYSGGRGFHVIGLLKKLRPTDDLRAILREKLVPYVETDNRLTLSTPKPGEIRLDVSTLHNLGSIRAPWSLNSVTGLVSLPIDVDALSSFKKTQATADKALPNIKTQPHLKYEDGEDHE